MRHLCKRHLCKRHLCKLPFAIAAIVGLNIAGASVLAETPPFDPVGAFEAPELPGDPEPDPDPALNPELPPGPGSFTDDPCDPVEGPCGDPHPDPDPGIPDGPGSFTDDPCDPVEGPCGGGADPDPQPDPDLTPVPETGGECDVDDVCDGTPTFTG
jgi:hypothetical protein